MANALQSKIETETDPQLFAAEIRGANKSYPGVIALDRVDFALRPGEVRALLGKNGAGKSTLIRLLTGAEIPDEGGVSIYGRPLVETGERRTAEAARQGVRVVYQELSLIPAMSIAENMFLGAWPSRGGVLRHSAMRRAATDALAAIGIDLDVDREIEALSPAQRQLVEIARAFIGDPRLVILDEPTSSLNAAEVGLVFEAVRKLAQRGIAIIYVSHRMTEIRQVADAATVLRDGRIIDTLPLRDATTRDIVRMMLGREESRTDAITRSEPGRAVLSVSHLKLAPKLDDISFELAAGEVLGIAGLLGSGRTELLGAIAGLSRPDAGTITLDGKDVGRPGYHQMLRLGIGLTPENRKDEGIVPLMDVAENTVMTDFGRVSVAGVLSAHAIKVATADIVKRMDVKTARQTTPLGTLSGGNQQKIVIGRWVYASSRILLLDEPTRGVDVEAKGQIYNIIRSLASEGRSVIFVSSEIEELPRVCDRVLVLRDGRITDEFRAGDMDADALMAASIADQA